ncbi:MAG: NADH-quinone oxidoreductase subunit J [Pseudomonadota bacterium]
MPDFSLLLTHGIFHILAALITVVSIFVVASKHPVKSAVFLVIDLFLLAAVYASLDSHFVAAIQVLVYAGAILVLFLFVIMLLNLQPEQLRGLKFSVIESGTLLISLIGLLIMIFTSFRGVQTGLGDGTLDVQAIEAAGGNTYVVGIKLLTSYIWPFELASILILLSIVAAIVIAKKDKKVLTSSPSGQS